MAGAALVAPLGLPLSVQAGPAPEPSRLVSTQTLQQWHAAKARGGPTFAGSAAWRAHVEFVERALRARGVVGLERDRIEYTRWFTSDDPDAGDWSLAIEGEPVPVASYWAYSGDTPPEGITAPLVRDARDLDPGELAGRIVVFEVPPLPDPLPGMFAPAGFEFATEDARDADGVAVTAHWYQVNYATRFGRLGKRLRDSGAAGGLVVFDMSRARAAGIYTFPLLAPGEVGAPGLYLDRVAGAAVLAAADAGAQATLRLRARRERAETWFLSGILPGRAYGTPADELVLLVTHTDGPNLTQENGALGILALVDAFAQRAQSRRERSLLIVLDPQHYMPGRHLVDWYARHPELTARIVASVGVEQLGQREYAERGERFEQTGRPEISVLFAQDSPLLIQWAREAIAAQALPRAVLRVPAHPGQGRWIGLGEIAVERGWPAYALNTEMSAYWSTRPGLESFDAALARRQLAVLAELTARLLAADLDQVTVPAAR